MTIVFYQTLLRWAEALSQTLGYSGFSDLMGSLISAHKDETGLKGVCDVQTGRAGGCTDCYTPSDV